MTYKYLKKNNYQLNPSIDLITINEQKIYDLSSDNKFLFCLYSGKCNYIIINKDGRYIPAAQDYLANVQKEYYKTFNKVVCLIECKKRKKKIKTMIEFNNLLENIDTMSLHFALMEIITWIKKMKIHYYIKSSDY